jgi:hypothetical protein
MKYGREHFSETRYLNMRVTGATLARWSVVIVGTVCPILVGTIATVFLREWVFLVLLIWLVAWEVIQEKSISLSVDHAFCIGSKGTTFQLATRGIQVV